MKSKRTAGQLTEQSEAIREQGEAERQALGLQNPAYRIRLGSSEAVIRGLDPRGSAAFAKAELLEAGEACIRNGRFCDGCARCHKGLRRDA
jgi:hypothetical protein